MHARSSAARWAALALALAPAAATAAGTTKPATSATPPAKAPAATANRGAGIPLPPPPAGTTLRATPRRALRVGALLGLASPQGNGGDGSLMLQADVSAPWRTTGAGVTLTWALPVRGIALAQKKAAGLDAGGYALEVTPTLRASAPLGATRFTLRTDAGIGVVARWTWVETDVTFVGRETRTAQDTTALLRLGVALEYALRPDLSLAVEPLTLGWDLDGNSDWIFAAGVSYRL